MITSSSFRTTLSAAAILLTLPFSLQAGKAVLQAQAAEGIVVDGALTETAWTGKPIKLLEPAFGLSHDVTATVRTRWDEKYFYVGVEVAEGAGLRYASPTANVWDSNAIEVFLDMDKDRSTEYKADDFQFILGLGAAGLFEKNKRLEGVLFATQAGKDSWTAELALPWALLGKTAKKGLSFGFDLAVDIDTKDQPDGGGLREGQLIWQGNINDYQDTSRFGTCTLAGKTKKK